MTDDDEMADILAKTRAKLVNAMESNHANTLADLVVELNRWCHEGCTVDGLTVGICSREVEHDGSVKGALVALKQVAQHVVERIDAGEEGC